MTNNKDQKKPNNKPETTGHEWDGISEYNIPAPRWWLIVWIICIIWSFGYWYFYPSWPSSSGNLKGSLNWTQVSQLKESQAEIQARKDVYLKKFSKSSFKEIMDDPELLQFALMSSEVIFKENCAACHGTGGQGAKGYPNLNDDDWLWGGKIEDIYQTLQYGIRSGHDKARFNQMPSFGLDKILNKEQIADVVDYVMSLNSGNVTNQNGQNIFKENCVSCHMNGGVGNQELGAPNLSDAIWLYGGSKEDITHSVTYARAGVMPFWKERLDEQTIRQLAIYVHSLGGGQ